MPHGKSILVFSDVPWCAWSGLTKESIPRRKHSGTRMIIGWIVKDKKWVPQSGMYWFIRVHVSATREGLSDDFATVIRTVRSSLEHIVEILFAMSNLREIPFDNNEVWPFFFADTGDASFHENPKERCLEPASNDSYPPISRTPLYTMDFHAGRLVTASSVVHARGGIPKEVIRMRRFRFFSHASDLEIDTQAFECRRGCAKCSSRDHHAWTSFRDVDRSRLGSIPFRATFRWISSIGDGMGFDRFPCPSEPRSLPCSMDVPTPSEDHRDALFPSSHESSNSSSESPPKTDKVRARKDPFLPPPPGRIDPKTEGTVGRSRSSASPPFLLAVPGRSIGKGKRDPSLSPPDLANPRRGPPIGRGSVSLTSPSWRETIVSKGGRDREGGCIPSLPSGRRWTAKEEDLRSNPDPTSDRTRRILRFSFPGRRKELPRRWTKERTWAMRVGTSQEIPEIFSFPSLSLTLSGSPSVLGSVVSPHRLPTVGSRRSLSLSHAVHLHPCGSGTSLDPRREGSGRDTRSFGRFEPFSSFVNELPPSLDE